METTASLIPLGVGAGFLAFGVLFLTSGRRLSRSSKRFAARSRVARAEVLDLRLRKMASSRDPDTGVWVPLVRFALPDGRVVEAETMVGGVPAPARRGEVVDVRYDPEDPTRVNVAGGLAQTSTIGCLHAGLGVGFILFGLTILGITGAVAWAVLR